MRSVKILVVETLAGRTLVTHIIIGIGLEHMRISAILMPFFALIAGIAGFYLRLMETWDVFDAQTGLPERGAAISLALIGLTVCFLVIIILFALRARIRFYSPEGFENAFGTDPLAYPFLFFFIGIIWLGATVKHFLDMNASGALPLSELLFSAMSALSAIAVALFAIEVYQDPRRKTKLVLSVVPTLFMCFWLILLYRRNAANPILLSYCYQCLAIISSALSFYFISGFVYSKPAPCKTIVAHFSAVYFCFVSLADDLTLSIKLLFAAIIAVNLIYASMLLRNMHRKRS